MNSIFFVYILRCVDGTLYTGYTDDVKKRLATHNSSVYGAKYTSGRRPVELVYSERHNSKSSALKREHVIKKLMKNQKESLIIIGNVRNELKTIATKKTRNSFRRFFKHEVNSYGVKSSDTKKIASKYKKQVLQLPKKQVFELCEQLLKSGVSEEAFIICDWIFNLNSQFDESDILIFEKWIDKYIDDWAKCDSFCGGSVGKYFEKFPSQLEILEKWAKSKNLWLRRASAVSIIKEARDGKLLKNVFKLSDILLEDSEDMVQKGYGWLLKESSRKNQMQIFDYVQKNKSKMPRTALRYAIELMPQNLRKEAMAK